MRRTLACSLVLIAFAAKADRIYLMNSPGYNTAPAHLIAAITALGHTVDVNSTTFTLPPGFASTCDDPVNGYDWLCLFGNNDFSALTVGVQTFIAAGGKVYYQYEVSCCTVSSSGAANMLSALTGLTITPNSNPYIALDGSAQGGWTATNQSCCATFIGNAYKGLDGMPLANQWHATAELNGATPPISTCLNFGFAFTTTDFSVPGSKGAICGVGDVNFWFDGKEPSNPVNPAVVEYFFPNSSSTCYLFEPGCSVNKLNSGSVFLGNDTTLCPGETLVLNAATGGGTYLWQDNSTNPTFTVTSAGTYWVDVHSSCGDAADTIVVAYDAAPLVDLGNDTTLCDGQSFILDVTIPGATYLWQDNSTAATFTVSQAGTYWVQVTDDCPARDTVVISYNPVPQVDLGNDTAICLGEAIILDATTPSATYIWHDNTTSTTHSATAGVTYSVAVIVNGCAGRDTITVADAHCGCHLVVANAFTPNGDGHNDLFIPYLDCSPVDYTFNVFDRWGQVVFETNDSAIGWDGTFRGRDMPIGVYTYLVRYTFATDPEPAVSAGNVTLLR